jgi:GNAT superfamily N-acetyltransferase
MDDFRRSAHIERGTDGRTHHSEAQALQFTDNLSMALQQVGFPTLTEQSASRLVYGPAHAFHTAHTGMTLRMMPQKGVVYIDYVSVHPDARGAEIGRRAVAAVIAAAEAAQFKHVRAVRVMMVAEDFWEHCGFRRVEVQLDGSQVDYEKAL